MKILILILAFMPINVYPFQFVENTNIALGQRILMRGADYLSMCSDTVKKINNKEKLKVNNCLLYVEGIRSGYSKATTEVLTRASFFHVGDGDPKKVENWEKGLASGFYKDLSTAVSHCELTASTASLTKQLYDFINVNNKRNDVLSSIYHNFLEKKYSGPCK